MALTVKELEALSREDKGKVLSDGGSLKGQVYAAKDGSVSVHFRFAYKFQGKGKNILVGTWPKMGLAEIRRERDALRVKIHSGIDPVEESRESKAREEASRKAEELRREAEHAVELLKIEADRQEALQQQHLRLQQLAENQARMTTRGLFEQWRRLELVQRSDQGSEVERSFNRDVFPLIGQVAAVDVSKAHIQEIIDTIKGRASEGRTMVRTAKKTLSDLRQMFGFALDRDYIEIDPTARIKKARIGADVERDRVLSEQEIITLFRKLPHAGMAQTTEIALMLQLSTLARIGEVLGARWEHVDMKRRQWVLPATKNGKQHDIWLSDFALQQFQRLEQITGLTPWLFPASRERKNKPGVLDHVCEKTVSKQVADRQRPGDEPMSGRSKLVDALVLPGGRWNSHDLRRTGATMMAELGALPDVVERCLNHTEQNKVKRIYQRAQYEGPMREAWRLLGERLELLEKQASGTADNVMTLKHA